MAGQAAPAPPTARPTQASRPGRSGNIDQQQSTSVFDQLTAEVVITSVAIVPAIALPSLARKETDTAALRISDVQDLPADTVDDRTSREAAGVGAENTLAVEDAPVDTLVDEPSEEAELEEASAEEQTAPQEDVVEDASSEPQVAEDTVIEESEEPKVETLTEEIIEELIEAVQEIEIVEDEAIATANDVIDLIVDAVIPENEEVADPEPEPEDDDGLQPVPVPANEAPTISAITDSGKDEDSAAYTLDLLDGAADADGDTLSVTNVSIAAVDQDGATYTLPSGTASVSGSTLSIDPSQLNELALGDEVVITVSYAVSDGTTSIANTATVTLDGTNEAPTISAITDSGKDEDSAAYTLDLLDGAADADGDTLSVTNVSIAAVDQDGATYTLPSGTASVSGSTLSIDPSQLNELALGDEVVITVSYAVSDGTTSIANTATVTLDGTNEAPTISAITDSGKDVYA